MIGVTPFVMSLGAAIHALKRSLVVYSLWQPWLLIYYTCITPLDAALDSLEYQSSDWQYA